MKVTPLDIGDFSCKLIGGAPIDIVMSMQDYIQWNFWNNSIKIKIFLLMIRVLPMFVSKSYCVTKYNPFFHLG